MRHSARALAVVGLGAFGFARCGGGGGGGSSTPTTPTTPTPTVSSITVTCPTSAANPGQSAQFNATATLSTGTTQAVTSQAFGNHLITPLQAFPHREWSGPLRRVTRTSKPRIRVCPAVCT
jgi:hypothetical protein